MTKKLEKKFAVNSDRLLPTDQLVDAEFIRQKLTEIVHRCSVQWLADQVCCSPDFIYLILEKRRYPSWILLDYLGYEKCILYRKKRTSEE